MAVNVVERIDEDVVVRHVLLSVSDKTGLADLVRGLVESAPGVRMFSTGGTFTAAADALGSKATGVLRQVSDYTGQPEMQGGLVKTLDFKIYMGLLSETYNDAHVADMKRVNATAIDMVVVNLYPFRETVKRPGATVEEARANVDIGGPCMVRASAKNYLRVASVTDPKDYPVVLAELRRTGGKLSLKTRWELAKKAFAHTAEYDKAISEYLKGKSFEEMKRCYRT